MKVYEYTIMKFKKPPKLHYEIAIKPLWVYNYKEKTGLDYFHLFEFKDDVALLYSNVIFLPNENSLNYIGQIKIRRSGYRSFSISLPKEWIEKNDMKPKDKVKTFFDDLYFVVKKINNNEDLK